MATTNLGKVAITPKGEWTSGISYKPLDVVYYSTTQASYMCLKETYGATPTSDSTKWMRLVGLTPKWVTVNGGGQTSVTISALSTSGVRFVAFVDCMKDGDIIEEATDCYFVYSLYTGTIVYAGAGGFTSFNSGGFSVVKSGYVINGVTYMILP